MIGWILGIILLLVFIFVLLSPLESLQWWADKGEAEVKRTFELLPREHCADEAEQYVVYLSGVGAIGGDSLAKRDRAFLDELQQTLPDAAVISDVFPYAVDNRGLTQRATVWIWGRLDKWRRRRAITLLPLLINVRNIAQVLVSADPRYGPTQSIGLAQEIWRSLQRHGYVAGSGTPVYLIGYSGGGQMALGSGWFLAGLGAPVSVISIGGIFNDDPGLDRVRHMWHLTGRRDHAHHLGSIAFPGRWPVAPLSPWGKAKHEGRVTVETIGPMGHDGAKGYFGRRAFADDGRAYADVTLDVVAGIIRGR